MVADGLANSRVLHKLLGVLIPHDNAIVYYQTMKWYLMYIWLICVVFNISKYHIMSNCLWSHFFQLSPQKWAFSKLDIDAPVAQPFLFVPIRLAYSPAWVSRKFKSLVRTALMTWWHGAEVLLESGLFTWVVFKDCVICQRRATVCLMVLESCVDISPNLMLTSRCISHCLPKSRAKDVDMDDMPAFLHTAICRLSLPPSPSKCSV